MSLIFKSFILIKPISSQWLCMVWSDLLSVMKIPQDFCNIKSLRIFFWPIEELLQTIMNRKILTRKDNIHSDFENVAAPIRTEPKVK